MAKDKAATDAKAATKQTSTTTEPAKK